MLNLNIREKWERHHQESHLKIWIISWLSKFWKISTIKYQVAVKIEGTNGSCRKLPWIIKERRIYNTIGILLGCTLTGAPFCIYIFNTVAYITYRRKSLEWEALKYAQSYLRVVIYVYLPLFSSVFSKINTNCKHSNTILLSLASVAQCLGIDPGTKRSPV